MDPVAHTLLGATAAEAGLRRLSRHATATLIVGANLPDVDGVAVFLGSDTSLLVRRGWTHGVLAMVILPAVLLAAIALLHRLRPPPADDRGPRFRPGRIAVLAYAATWSHPALDLLNTYGVRLLAPFDGRWFYGDTLFIVDPWFWLLTAAGVVLGRSAGRRALVGWIVLGALATVLVLLAPMVPAAVRLGWCAGIGVLAWLRARRPARASAVRVARVGLAGFLVYLGAAIGLARLAESTAMAAAERDGRPPEEAQANPVPGNPFAHRMVLVYDDRYRVVPSDAEPFDVPRRERTTVVDRAARDPSVRGFMTWTRFPYWDVEETADGWVVTFRDLRYVDPGEPGRGIGLARVAVPRLREVDGTPDR